MNSLSLRTGALLRAFFILASFCGAPLMAQAAADRVTGIKISGDQPVQIESDKLEMQDKERMATFTGNVAVVQGTTLLKAGKLVVHYASNGGAPTSGTAAIERLEVSGKVYVKSDDQIATGDAATFDMKSQLLVLTGKQVVLSQGANVAVGQKLTVHMKTGVAQLDGGRVSMVLDPKSQPKN